MTTIQQTRQAQQTWNTWPLTAWLHGVKARGYTIRFDAGLPHLAPLNGQTKSHPVIRDYHFLRRHKHALAVAAALTHPKWWAFASGQSSVPPAINDIPTVADPTSVDGLAFACACCGEAALTISDRAMPWCPEHDPEAS